MKQFLFFLLSSFLLFGTAHSDELMIHGLSWHKDATYEDKATGEIKKHNNVNPGVTYLFDNGFGIGVYKNSYYKTTVHVDYRYMLTDNFGAFIGIGTGYSEQKTKGLIGGFVLRTNKIGDGYRINLMGSPFGNQAILTLAVSKEF